MKRKENEDEESRKRRKEGEKKAAIRRVEQHYISQAVSSMLGKTSSSSSHSLSPFPTPSPSPSPSPSHSPLPSPSSTASPSSSVTLAPGSAGAASRRGTMGIFELEKCESFNTYCQRTKNTVYQRVYNEVMRKSSCGSSYSFSRQTPGSALDDAHQVFMRDIDIDYITRQAISRAFQVQVVKEKNRTGVNSSSSSNKKSHKNQ